MPEVPNYTPEQVDALKAANPVTYGEAVAFAELWGKSTKSVISKVGHLGLEYVRKPVPVKRPTPLTKSQLVDLIAWNTGVESLEGLENAKVPALKALLTAVS